MIIPRPDVAQLAERIRSEISYRALNGSPVLPMSIEDVLSFVMAGSMFETYGAVEQFYRELEPETASCDGLYAWARRRGLFANGATQSQGFVTVTGIPLSVVPTNTTWISDDDQVYAVSPLAGPVTLNISGSAAVPIRAVNAGISGNVASGVELSMAQTVPGLNVRSTVTPGGISGGSDLEDCESFRKRILGLRRQGILSTNADWLLGQIARWPGLTRSCVVDCNSCFNDSFVEIAVFFDGVYLPHGVPPQSVLDDMNAWMFGTPVGAGKGIAPVGLAGTFIASQATPISIDLACTTICPPGAVEVLKTRIAQRLKELICSGGNLCKGDIDFVIKSYLGRGCIASASYEYDQRYVTDSGPDLVFQCGYFPVIENITFVS